MADTNDRAFLLELSGGQAAPPLPQEVRDEFADTPDDETLFTFVSDVIEVGVEGKLSLGLVASAIAHGLLDLGFKR
ncbi:hypothetical protein GS534_24380 [Rhodococcus hoagii]|nr:hypothetical protein [Prescottella equi]MBM4617933.1 hypothetical protein [Prescottella equi]NKS33168.1 hypothetical protein [Prescottella equi]